VDRLIVTLTVKEGAGAGGRDQHRSSSVTGDLPTPVNIGYRCLPTSVNIGSRYGGYATNIVHHR
jgi:hypothetical protein